MRNKVRLFLLVSSIVLVFSFGYMFMSNHKGSNTNVKVSLGETGVDISIENFNVTHEELGNKIWELKAKTAKINSTTKVTQLTHVEMILHQKDHQQSYIYADNGILYEATKDFELNGNVRLISNVALINKQFR